MTRAASSDTRSTAISGDRSARSGFIPRIRVGSLTPSVAHDITPRQKMLGDVVDNVLPGKTRAEIEAILGSPEETSCFANTGRDLIYSTGPERDTPFSIDSEWLLIWLDDQGRFERYAVYRD
jgi:outer membrane protein assembly factor BamE (lipoprotein component of BamABCDE complex)